MKFIKNLREKLEWTQYKLARELNIPTNSLNHLETKAIHIAPAELCRLRKLSKLSWTAYGRLLDDEFLE